MPDITKCNGGNCPIKNDCFRYWSKPSAYQSYFENPPYKNDECDHYWFVPKYENGQHNAQTGDINPLNDTLKN